MSATRAPKSGRVVGKWEFCTEGGNVVGKWEFCTEGENAIRSNFHFWPNKLESAQE